MYSLVTTNKFAKDLKRAKKRHKDLSKLKNIMDKLLERYELPVKNKEIIFERTGTHSDLFY